MVDAQDFIPTAARRGNPVGVIALIAAIIGVVLAALLPVMPLALLFCWLLVAVGFVLGIVGMALPRRVRWHSVAAVIASVAGGGIAVIMLFVVFVGV